MESRDQDGLTPLHEACSMGNLRVARALLQCGADPDSSSENGRRPLHNAVESGHVEVVRLLLSYGADASLPTCTGLTPLELARSPIMVELLRGFLSDMAGESIDGSPVLPWHFAGTVSFMDPEENGFDVLADAPHSAESTLSQMDEAAKLPTYRLTVPALHLADETDQTTPDCVLLDDVLLRTRLTADEFRQRFPGVEVLSLPGHDLQSKTPATWLEDQSPAASIANSAAPSDRASSFSTSVPVQVIRLDATLRGILGLQSPVLR